MTKRMSPKRAQTVRLTNGEWVKVWHESRLLPVPMDNVDRELAYSFGGPPNSSDREAFTPAQARRIRKHSNRGRE